MISYALYCSDGHFVFGPKRFLQEYQSGTMVTRTHDKVPESIIKHHPYHETRFGSKMLFGYRLAVTYTGIDMTLWYIEFVQLQ